jgi:hypothetical protein
MTALIKQRGHGALRVEPVRLTIDQWRKIYGHLLETYNFKTDWRRKDQVSPRDLHRLKRRINVEDVSTPGQVSVVRDATSQREIPLWMNNDEAIRDLLVAQFPNIKGKQMSTAALWLHAIRLFRQNEPASEIARLWKYETGQSVDAAYIRRVIQQINFVVSGLRTDGGARTAKKLEPAENMGLD